MATIFVIDDQVPVRIYLRAILGAAGHTVREAGDGQAAIEAIVRDAPDLILCDLFMPGKEGLETIKDLRNLAPTIPIIAMSGGGMIGVIDSLKYAVMLGATTALAKPISYQVLKQTIDDLLAQPVAICSTHSA